MKRKKDLKLNNTLLYQWYHFYHIFNHENVFLIKKNERNLFRLIFLENVALIASLKINIFLIISPHERHLKHRRGY